MPTEFITQTESADGIGYEIRYHSGQSRALESKARFPFIIAGTQSGKTCFGPWWLNREIETCGPGDYLAVTATYDLFKLKMLPELKAVFGRYIPGWEYKASDRIMWKSNPGTDKITRIILRSADAEGGLESASAKGAWLDECGQDKFKLGAWEAVQRRLSLYGGRALGTTTPYNLGWLKTEVFDRWAAGDTDFGIINFKSIMNPIFPRAEYDRMKRILPAWKFHMFYDGTFERPAGLIYSDYDEGMQKVKPFDIPAEWPRYVGIDFGAVNTAVLWIAEDPNTHCYYIYRCMMMGGKTTKEKAIMALAYKHENTVRWIGGAKSETQERMDWNAEGVPVQESPIVSVEAGIDRVIELFKTRRLFVFNTCKGLLDELGTYSRVLNEYGQPTEKIKDKADYHRLDALRYNISGIGFSLYGGINV